MITPRLWYVHPSDSDTWVAEVPGGVLVRVIDLSSGTTDAIAFVPGARLEAFHIAPEPGWRWDEEAGDMQCTACRGWHGMEGHKPGCTVVAVREEPPPYPSAIAVAASEDAFGFIHTTIGPVPMCGCAFTGQAGKIFRCTMQQLHLGPHSAMTNEVSLTEDEIAEAFGGKAGE
jgi:hypothetical protein